MVIEPSWHNIGTTANGEAPMISHDKIARHPRTFKTLTNLSTEGFNQILPSFEEAWESDLDRPGRWAGAATQARRWAQGEAGGHGGHAGVHPDVFPALPHPDGAGVALRDGPAAGERVGSPPRPSPERGVGPRAAASRPQAPRP